MYVNYLMYLFNIQAFIVFKCYLDCRINNLESHHKIVEIAETLNRFIQFFSIPGFHISGPLMFQIVISDGQGWGGVFVNLKGNVYSFIFLRRKAFIMTDNELKLMAVAAIIGDNNMPKTG